MNRLEQLKSELQDGTCDLPNGCTLYWKTDMMGGREYYTDECGAAFPIWCTTTVDQSSLLAAMVKEAELQTFERWEKEKNAKKSE